MSKYVFNPILHRRVEPAIQPKLYKIEDEVLNLRPCNYCQTIIILGKRLFTGTWPTNNKNLIGTVTANNKTT